MSGIERTERVRGEDGPYADAGLRWGGRFVPGPLAQSATAMLEGIGQRLWGFPPRLMAPIVSYLGPRRALCWFIWNMPRYERTLRMQGGVRTHLMCTVISLINGCEYCTFGHAYALQLIYLREYGRLFPMDEFEFGRLLGQQPGMVRRRVEEALQFAGLHGEIRWLDRTVALASGDARPSDASEIWVAHLVRMFRVLNSVGISDRTTPDEAHDPVNKNGQLRLRYDRLRDPVVV